MLIVVTNLTANTLGPIAGLPDGGRIKGPANTVSSFSQVRSDDFDVARKALDDLVDAGHITYRVRADVNDHGEHVYTETLTVTHADMTAAALSQTVESDFTFPTGAVLLSYRHNLGAEFAGPGIEGAAKVQGGVGPYNLEPGQTLVLDVDGGGDDTATFDASAAFDQTKAAPFNMRDGDVFTVAVDGGAPITVTVNAADVVDVTAITAVELKAILDAIGALTAVATTSIQGGTDVRITSRKRGTASRVVIGGFNPAAAGGAVAQGNSGPFNLEPGQTLVLDVNGGGDDTATFDASQGYVEGGLGPFDLADNDTLTFAFQGGDTQSVLIQAGDVGNIDAVTVDELVTLINGQIVGGHAVKVGGKLRIRSDRRGTSSTVSAPAGTAAAALGFAAPIAGGGRVANIDAVSEAEAKTIIEADIAGVTVTTGDPGGLIITTNLTGAARTLEVKNASTAVGLGFAAAVTNGFDSVATALTLDGETVGAGDAADIDAVTEAEAKTVIEADIAGVTVVTGDPDGLIIKTAATGSDVSLEVKGASTAVGLGFAAGVANGTDGLNSVTTVDVGIGAGADADVLADGANVATGAGTGYKFTSGAHGVGHNPLDLSGKKLRVKVESGDNVDNMTAGSITAEAKYAVL